MVEKNGNTHDSTHRTQCFRNSDWAGCQWLMPVIRDQEDCGLKPPGQIVCETLSWKNSSQKRAVGVAQDVGPEFKLQYHKKKKKKERKRNSD
jgi:hypothetical protein